MHYADPWETYGSTKVLITSSWTEVVIPIVPIPKSGGPVQVSVTIQLDTTGLMWIDDASLKVT